VFAWLAGGLLTSTATVAAITAKGTPPKKELIRGIWDPDGFVPADDLIDEAERRYRAAKAVRS
jgi:hypothetical protein